MQLNNLPARFWYVHTNGGSTYNSVWTSREEARDCKRRLKSNGINNVVISYANYTVDPIRVDLHS